ncbi:MAG: hypothetical protein LBI87_14575 [Candidatus Accumulibacter sp.]|jgi:hypothetical protein|nr:hypothetical protein [Accumulibacter sp.]
MNNGNRLSWGRLAALAGLLFVGALAVMNRVELARLAEAVPAETQDTRLQALAMRVTELAQEVEHDRTRPENVSLERHEAERQAVEQRLAAIEQALIERSGDDLQSLRDRLSRLEEERAQQAANLPVLPVENPPAPPPNPSPKPKIAEPSFRVIGVERRAEERFLVILPGQAEALAQARLLRVGDQADGWRLEAIEDEAGIFSQGGRKRRLHPSGGKP